MANKVPQCSNCGSNSKGHRTFICSGCKGKYCDGYKSPMFGDYPHCGSGLYSTLSVVGCLAVVTIGASIFYAL